MTLLLSVLMGSYIRIRASNNGDTFNNEWREVNE